MSFYSLPELVLKTIINFLPSLDIMNLAKACGQEKGFIKLLLLYKKSMYGSEKIKILTENL